eukprot:COSAG01_NODE_55525_length_324_cov_1.146667_1_plen_71_part_10
MALQGCPSAAGLFAKAIVLSASPRVAPIATMREKRARLRAFLQQHHAAAAAAGEGSDGGTGQAAAPEWPLL